MKPRRFVQILIVTAILCGFFGATRHGISSNGSFEIKSVGDIAATNYEFISYQVLWKLFLSERRDLLQSADGQKIYAYYRECTEYKKNMQIEIGSDSYLSSVTRRAYNFVGRPQRRFVSVLPAPARLGRYDDKLKGFPVVLEGWDFGTYALRDLDNLSLYKRALGLDMCAAELRAREGTIMPEIFHVAGPALTDLGNVKMSRSDAKLWLESRYDEMFEAVDREVALVVMYRIERVEDSRKGKTRFAPRMVSRAVAVPEVIAIANRSFTDFDIDQIRKNKKPDQLFLKVISSEDAVRAVTED